MSIQWQEYKLYLSTKEKRNKRIILAFFRISANTSSNSPRTKWYNYFLINSNLLNCLIVLLTFLL